MISLNDVSKKEKLNSVRLFKGVIQKEKTSLLNEEALAPYLETAKNSGVNIDKEALYGLSTDSAKDFIFELIDLYGVDLAKTNSTFFKTFKESNDTPLELRVFLQALHYASTYGNIEELRNSGEIFEPTVINEENWSTLKTISKTFIEIKVFSEDEFVEKVTSLVSSGMALSDDDLEFLFYVITNDFALFDKKNKDFISLVNNRELTARLALALDVVPYNFDDLMKIIFFAVIDSTLVINNKKSKKLFTLADNDKKAKGNHLLMTYIQKWGINEASKHVTRYRDFIMLLKTEKTKSTINKLLKLSKTNYVARKVDPLSTITSPNVTAEDAREILDNSFAKGTLNIYRLIRLINAVSIKIAAGKDEFKDVVRVRNGKLHISDTKRLTNEEYDLLSKKELILVSFIRKLLEDKVKNKAFIFDESFVPVAPTSGKSFSGFLPEYSYFNLGEERGVVGVAWSKPGDIDLHGSTVGESYGWNSSWGGDEKVTYTGDMTDLNKYGFAAEFYESKLPEGAMLNVSASPFSYREDTDYQLIVASGKSKERQKLNNIKSINESIEDIVYLDSRKFTGRDSQQLFSIVKLDGIYRAIVTSGSLQGAHVVKHDHDRATIDYQLRAVKSRLTMERLIRFAGGSVYKDSDPSDEEISGFKDFVSDWSDNAEVEIVDLRAKNITKDLFTSIFG